MTLNALENDSYWWASKSYFPLVDRVKTNLDLEKYHTLGRISNIYWDMGEQEKLERNGTETFVLLKRKFPSSESLARIRNDSKHIAYTMEFIAKEYMKYPMYNQLRDTFEPLVM